MTAGIVVPVKPDGSAYFAGSKALSDTDIASLWKSSNAKPRPGESRIFYAQGADKNTTIALVGTGDIAKLSKNELLERSRVVAAVGVKALREAGCDQVEIETGSSDASSGGLDAHAASTAVHLALHKFDWKTGKADKEKKKPVNVSQVGGNTESDKPGSELDWSTGKIYAYSQNLARELKDTPANMMTPTIFCERIKKEFQGIDNVTINVYDEAWAKEKGMGSFLSVAAGTDEPAKFLEIIYNGARDSGKETDVTLVGKGITFDSGGISLKPGAAMKAMRADMGGAACVTSSMLAIAKLKLPINMVTVTPLTENLPSGKATKPGDIVTSMAGKTIEIDNTDAEGRLVLADALYYATSVYKPKVCIDVATLTGAQMFALADIYAGVFSTDDKLFADLQAAGSKEYDEVWRMPFHNKYLKYIDGTGADLCNTGGRAGGACTAAIFLKQFIAGFEPEEGEQQESDKVQEARKEGKEDLPKIAYAHIDIAGVMEMSSKVAQPYDVVGMSGKPVRALVEYIRTRAYKL